jgi:hypothetical protein
MSDDARLANGVRVRLDGRGDNFANAHRKGQRDLYGMDVDAYATLELVVGDGEDRIFAEYCLHGNGPVTESAFVAFFDRKKMRGKQCIADAGQMARRAPWLGLCRDLAVSYPVTPRLFWICGQGAPWDFIEWDVRSGERLRWWLLESDDITQEWRNIDLLRDRETLVKWLRRGKTYAPRTITDL